MKSYPISASHFTSGFEKSWHLSIVVGRGKVLNVFTSIEVNCLMTSVGNLIAFYRICA